MRLSELDYQLPPELIAQQPVHPRDRSRLLIYDSRTGGIEHRHLPDLISCLLPGDTVVYNDSRVIKARIQAFRSTGGRVELLFLRRHAPGLWEVLAGPSARLKEGEELDIPGGGAVALEERLGEGRWLLRNESGLPTLKLLERAGEVPLPPYIKEKLRDPERYQTVYAGEPGSAAAPTAGLHFTPRLLEQARAAGAGLFPVTLHVGLDTFRPISADDLNRHSIHKEYFRIPEQTAAAVTETRARGGRVIAVGTTSVRVLETVFGDGGALEGETGLFITPGYRFRCVDALLTNFHLPKSTLLALVMAFAGADEIRRIYSEAIERRYRFYSFGDAMFLQ